MRLFKLVCILCLLASCSVKENRAGCPCCLLVVQDAAARDGVSAYIYDLPEKLDEKPVGADGTECEVPRKQLRVTYIKYPAGMPRDNEMYKIPFGSECDSLYAYTHLVDCSGEQVVDTLKLNKNFASLFGRFLGEDIGGRAVVSGNVCGISIPELELVDGAFRHEPEVGKGGRFQMQLPRQKDDELLLEIFDESGNLLWDYPLGMKIKGLGYDWNAQDLSDIELEIEASSMYVYCRIVPWSDGGVEDETI